MLSRYRPILHRWQIQLALHILKQWESFLFQGYNIGRNDVHPLLTVVKRYCERIWGKDSLQPPYDLDIFIRAARSSFSPLGTISHSDARKATQQLDFVIVSTEIFEESLLYMGFVESYETWNGSFGNCIFLWQKLRDLGRHRVFMDFVRGRKGRRHGFFDPGSNFSDVSYAISEGIDPTWKGEMWFTSLLTAADACIDDAYDTRKFELGENSFNGCYDIVEFFLLIYHWEAHDLIKILNLFIRHGAWSYVKRTLQLHTFSPTDVDWRLAAWIRDDSVPDLTRDGIRLSELTLDAQNIVEKYVPGFSQYWF